MTEYKGKRPKYDLIESLVSDALPETAHMWRNNTLKYETERGAIGYQLHDTEIARVYPDGVIRLNSGGYQTNTTKSRMNEILCEHLGWAYVVVHQQNWEWFLYSGSLKNDVPFVDGIEIWETNNCLYVRSSESEDVPKSPVTRQQVNKYAAEFAQAFERGKVGNPTTGDCFYCAMRDASNVPLGESIGDTSHLESHIEESYFVPSLLARVVDVEKGTRLSQYALWWIADIAHKGESDLPSYIGREQLKKAIAHYLAAQFGLAR